MSRSQLPPVLIWGETTPPTAIRKPEMGLGAAVPPEYRQRESLFTYRERAFFKVLLEDVGSQYAVCSPK
jgi:hypothetical protein